MLAPIIVTFDHKDYTWDGKRWYGTMDHMTPPLGMIHKLQVLLPEMPAQKVKKPATKRA